MLPFSLAIISFNKNKYLCSTIILRHYIYYMRKFYYWAFYLIAIVLDSCSSETHYEPQNGDLFFVVANSSNVSKAISDATAWNDSIKFDHVAIVAVDEKGPYILEASSRRDVSRTEWNTFIGNAPKVNGKPGIVVKRLNVPFDADMVISLAKSHIGEKYDWSYRHKNGKMYCSELVYECFLNPDGSHIFSAQPMNFRDKDGYMPRFWRELFERIGEEIPEGLPGTNPNDMSKEDCLDEVYLFF